MEDETQKYYSDCKERHYSHPVVQAFAEPKIEWITSKINLKDKTILEIGGGNGYFSSELVKKGILTTLDISSHQLKYNPAKDKINGTVYELPFKDNEFDIIFCSNLLHHLDNPINALNEMKRVAKNTVIISEANRRNPILFIGALILKRERNAIKYSKKFVASLIKKTGLTIKYHSFFGGLVMPNDTPVILLPYVGKKSTNSFSFFQIFICNK